MGGRGAELFGGGERRGEEKEKEKERNEMGGEGKGKRRSGFEFYKGEREGSLD